MVLQDLGRRINSAVNDLTRSNNLDEKVSGSMRWLVSYYDTGVLIHIRPLMRC